MHTQKPTISSQDYELSCQYAAQLQTICGEQLKMARQSICDFADKQEYFIDRYPNLWNAIKNDIANFPIEQAITKPVICGAGYTLDTALRYLREQADAL